MTEIEGLDLQIPEVTPRSSKADLLEAYNDLVERFKARETEAPAVKVEAEKRRQAEMVSTAREWTVERVITSIGELKVGLGSSLDGITQKLTGQSERLAQVNEAIGIQSARLKELHDIEVAADSLSILLRNQKEAESDFDTRLAQKREEAQQAFLTAKEEVLAEIEEAKSQFEAEMSERRQAWQEEQEEVARTRKREQDEYSYNLKQQRAREADAYQAKKEALEKELVETKARQESALAEREKNVKTHEDELARLRSDAESFPTRLEQAVAAARETAKKEAEREAEVAARLQAQISEGEKNVSKLQIANLQAKVAEQAATIAALSTQLATAGEKVETIATKAIEGAASRAALLAVNDIAMEQAKRPHHS